MSKLFGRSETKADTKNSAKSSAADGLDVDQAAISRPALDVIAICAACDVPGKDGFKVAFALPAGEARHLGRAMIKGNGAYTLTRPSSNVQH